MDCVLVLSYVPGIYLGNVNWARLMDCVLVICVPGIYLWNVTELG